MVTDRAPQQSIHLSCNALAVTVPDRIKQGIPIPFPGAVIEPFDNGRFKDLFNFRIRNHKDSHAIWQIILIISSARFR